MRLRMPLQQPVTVPPLDGQSASPVPDGHRPTGRRWPRAVAIGLATGLVGSASLWALSGRGSSTTDEPTKATATAKVTRQNLVSRVDVDGTLGYSGQQSVVSQLQGTVTEVPGAGSVIERGQTLYKVDNRPVPLLYGDLPAWRRLAADTGDGPDIRQLEQNLVALGFATEQDLTVDDDWTSATTAAVKRWQKALGVEQTGAIEPGQAIFLPGAIRVGEIRSEKGTQVGPGAPIFTATGTTRIVSIDLDASKQALVKVGDKVEVKLPNGRTTTGSIAAVGGAARTTGQGQNAKQVVSVTVALDDPAATGTIDQAPVRVGMISDSRTGVLAVPVNALLALAEGGYGVRVVEGGASRIVAVETGLFAKGMVEVTGDGLQEGMDVEVPAA